MVFGAGGGTGNWIFLRRKTTVGHQTGIPFNAHPRDPDAAQDTAAVGVAGTVTVRRMRRLRMMMRRRRMRMRRMRGV